MRVLALSVMLLLGVVCAPSLAQTELGDKQKAVVVFDIQMDRIRSSDLAKSLNLAEKMNGLKQSDSPNPANLERVFGALSAPENMAAAQGIQQGQMPIEFFVRIKFSESEDVDRLVAKFGENTEGVVERNGKTYFKFPVEAGAPAGIMGYAVDDVTFEIGTEAYIFRSSDDAKPFTDGLTAAWGNVPDDDAIRIAIDLEGARGLISEVVEVGQKTSPPVVGEYLNLIAKMKDLRISFDVTGKNLITIQSTGVDSAGAESLKEGVDSLLGMAMYAGQTQLAEVKKMDPEGGAVIEALLNSLKATQEGAEVSIVIPKPEGFDKAVEKAVNMIPMMMGGGMGGPGGPGGPPPGSPGGK